MGRILVAVAAIAITLFLQGEAQEYPRAAARLPTLLGHVVILLALLAVCRELLVWRRAQAEGTLSLFRLPSGRDAATGAGFLLLIVLYAWSIPVLGYLVATPLMLLIPLAALRPVGWRPALVTVVSVTSVIWIVFVWFLNLPVPLLPGD